MKRSPHGGRQTAPADWVLAAAVAGAVLVYLRRHWHLLEDPLRRLLEVWP